MISEDIFQIQLCMIDSYLDQSIHKTAVVSREPQWPSKVFDWLLKDYLLRSE